MTTLKKKCIFNSSVCVLGVCVIRLEQESSHASHFALLLDKYLEVLVDDGDGEEDSGSGPDGAHEVCADGQGSDAEASERRRRGNVPVQLVDH